MGPAQSAAAVAPVMTPAAVVVAPAAVPVVAPAAVPVVAPAEPVVYPAGLRGAALAPLQAPPSRVGPVMSVVGHLVFLSLWPRHHHC